MGRELYMRDTSDPNYKEGVLEVNDKLEMLISQLKMILMTNRGEILGAPEFGMNLEDQLYSFNVNENGLRQLFEEQIIKFCPLFQEFNIGMDVSFFKGTVRDICLIDITINGQKVIGVIVK